MALPANQIKAALLHPDQIVRDVALHYFADSFSLDPTIMPLVIGAIERLGWDNAFEYFYIAQNLVQTDETLLWLVSQLDGTRLTQDNAARVGSIIHHADAGLLARHESRLADCKWLDGDHRKVIREKISLLSVSADACWKELEDLCERYQTDKHGDQLPVGRANRLVEALSRDGHRYAERVLTVLSHKVEDFENDPLLWLEIFAAMLAGLARLDGASPLLVAKLKQDNGDYINEECSYALTKIGSDAAVDAIAKDFHSGPDHYCMYASSALEDMRGQNVVAAALDLLKQGKGDLDVRAKFVGAVLANFDTEGLAVAREFGIHDLPEYRRRMIAVATLTGADLPELEELRQDEEGNRAAAQRRREWFLGGVKQTAQPRIEEPVDPPVVQPIKSGPKVGRNDPCPCGSGKKYKKCCMGKD